jgi:predicted ArsR family transcriptional regulator
MAPRAPILREKCLQALSLGPLTADEVADRVGATVLAIRPRISELARTGDIMDTGDRRPNASGHKAIVWKIRADPLAWLC